MTIDERICDIIKVIAVRDISGLTCKMAACAIYSGSITYIYQGRCCVLGIHRNRGTEQRVRDWGGYTVVFPTMHHPVGDPIDITLSTLFIKVVGVGGWQKQKKK